MLCALIVEDQEETAALFAQLLESMGWTAVSAHTGTEVLEALEAGRLSLDSFAIAFIDVNLPDLNGIELVRLLRQRVSSSSSPSLAGRPRFVGTSGYRESDLAPLDTDAQLFDAYLQKPIDFDALEALLSTAVQPAPEGGDTADGEAMPVHAPPAAVIDTQALRHHLMGRVWGRVEHDLAGGLSAARLQLAVATRTLAKLTEGPPSQGLLDSFKQVETFMKQSAAALRRTSWWHAHPQEPFDVAQVLQQVGSMGKDVMRPEHFSVSLALPDGADAAPLMVTGRHDPCHAFLAAVLHFRDTQPAPFVLRVNCLPSPGQLAVRFVQEVVEGEVPEAFFTASPAPRPSLLAELDALWRETGWQAKWSPDRASLTLTAALD